MRWLPLIIFCLSCSSGDAQELLPGPTAVRQLASDLLRQEAATDTDSAKADAIVVLCDLYAAIRVHPQYEKSEMLRADAIRVRRRLLNISRELSDRLDREKVVRQSGLSSRVDAVLAMSTSDQANSDQQLTKGGAAPAAIADNGWALVELIQRTVHPGFWEVAGGPGTIRYFAIKRVLVVGATTEVHEALTALLRQL